MQNTIHNLCARLLVIIALFFVSAARADYKSTVLADQPVGYWPLNLSVDTAGSATDLSGNGNNGTYIQIVLPSNEVAGPSAYILNGVSLNGTGAFVDLSTGTNTSVLNFGGQITMEIWVQPASSQINSIGDIFAKGWLNGGNYNELEMSVVGNDFRGGRDSGNYVDSGPAGTNWAHVVTTYDGTNWNLYVNGQSVGTHGDTVGASPFDDPWAIGNGTDGGAGRLFTGNICQTALYANALTPTHVAAHYYMGVYGTTNFAPVITAQPESLTVYTNTPAIFNVTALSAAPLSYQWWKGTSPLGGQTDASLSIGNAQLSDAGSYSVVITNIYGAVTSSVANLAVLTAMVSLSAYESNILADNPIGYWPLDLSVDLSGPAMDFSGNGNNGTYVSIVSPADEVPGPSAFIAHGVSFDGSSAWVDLSTGTNTSVFNFAGLISMETWVQPARAQIQRYRGYFRQGLLR